MNQGRQNLKRVNRRTLLRLGVVAIAMFGFGYALVPLYDLICDITGLNGKTGRVDAANVQAAEVDQSRWITVEFTGHTTSGLPWEFRPLQKKMRVHPGETAVANYYVSNNTDETITGQAVPSVVPGRAAPYFKKIECFCFSQQTLAPREAKEMPVRFVVDAKISSRVDTITLSYAFFNTDKASAKKYGGDSMAVNHDGHHVHAHQAAPDG